MSSISTIINPPAAVATTEAEATVAAIVKAHLDCEKALRTGIKKAKEAGEKISLLADQLGLKMNEVKGGKADAVKVHAFMVVKGATLSFASFCAYHAIFRDWDKVAIILGEEVVLGQTMRSFFNLVDELDGKKHKSAPLPVIPDPTTPASPTPTPSAVLSAGTEERIFLQLAPEVVLTQIVNSLLTMEDSPIDRSMLPMLDTAATIISRLRAKVQPTT